MVRFYVLQIRMQKITLSDVNDKWREAVEEALKSDSEENKE